jgi:hypothetical protein
MEKKNVTITGIEIQCPPYDLINMRNDVFKSIRKEGFKIPDISGFKNIVVPFKKMDRLYGCECKVPDSIFREVNKYFYDTTDTEFKQFDSMGPCVYVNINLKERDHIIVAEYELMGDITIRSTYQKDIEEIQNIINKHTSYGDRCPIIQNSEIKDKDRPFCKECNMN